MGASTGSLRLVRPFFETVLRELEVIRPPMNKAIGIMGGTFDPIHVGHLVCAEEVRARFRLDQVIFVPCGVPAHKKPYAVTDPWHRYLMVELATASNPYFTVSRIEVDAEGPSYTIDTVRAMREQFGESTRLYFITGADAILDILSWHDNQSLKHLCRFVAATRPGYDLSQLRRQVGDDWMEHIDTVPIPGIDISSTAIRQRVREHLPIRYLTPEPTENYIIKHGLYREDTRPSSP